MRQTDSIDLENWLTTIQLTIENQQESYALPFAKPFHLVTMGLAMKMAGRENFRLPDSLVRYAARMNVWDAVGMPQPCSISAHTENGKFLPVEAFVKPKTDTAEIISRLSKIVLSTSKNQHEELNICLSELINNFYDHAEAPNDLPCLVAAQAWQRGGLVQVAIVDMGIGIRSSLAQNSELASVLSTMNACKVASEYGVTSKPGKGHAGYGLTLASDLMRQVGGTYALISGNELYLIQDGKEVTKVLSCCWPGTILVLEWKIDKRLDCKSVYDSWPNPNGFDKNDYF